MNMESQNDWELEIDELIFLVGGYDGNSLLPALDSYSPMHDVIMPLQPMNYARAYASVAILKDELYAIGGGDGRLWLDTGFSLHFSLSTFVYVCVMHNIYIINFVILFL